jgi:hypothetical protein
MPGQPVHVDVRGQPRAAIPAPPRAGLSWCQGLAIEYDHVEHPQRHPLEAGHVQTLERLLRRQLRRRRHNDRRHRTGEITGTDDVQRLSRANHRTCRA